MNEIIKKYKEWLCNNPDIGFQYDEIPDFMDNLSRREMMMIMNYLVSNKKEELSKFCISLYNHSTEQGYNPMPLEAQISFIENYTKE